MWAKPKLNVRSDTNDKVCYFYQCFSIVTINRGFNKNAHKKFHENLIVFVGDKKIKKEKKFFFAFDSLILMLKIDSNKCYMSFDNLQHLYYTFFGRRYSFAGN